MSDPLPLQPERVLEHAGWVRSLARRLTRDASSADDLAQQTFAAAVEHPPGTDRPVRRWLAAVMRNFARQTHRAESRRVARERASARSEALPSTAELVERLNAQRRVAEAALELEEPYRTAILLRFYEGLPPRQIARREGVPVETVKTRLSRGLERLRVKLDRAYGGDRRAWLLALAPLGKPSFLAAPPILEAALMEAKAKVAVAALVVLAPLAVWVALPGGSETPRPTAAGAPDPPKPSQAARASPSESPPVAARTEVRPASPAASPREGRPAASAPVVPPAAVLRGRVLGADGTPLPGVRVEARWQGTEERGPQAVSGADGGFEMQAPDRSGQIHAVGPELTTVLAGVYGDPRRRDPVVVVAPRIALGGRVVDEESLPVRDVQVAIDVPATFRTRFREILDASVAVESRTATDEQGLFAFPDVPRVEGGRLLATRQGFQPHEEPSPAFADANLVITLRRPRSADALVRGRVVDADGNPVAEANVSFGLNTTRSDDKGEFAFKIEEPESFNARMRRIPTALLALKKGFLPARYDAPLKDGRPSWPSSVTLRLGGSPLAISGRVLDARGEPVSGARVWLADPTLFGATERGLRHVENLIVDERSDHWRFVQTDATGAFRIEGLLDRPYRLAALDRETLLRTEEGPFQAGDENVLLRMPAGALYDRVAGRVTSRSGRPVAGATIFPMCDAFRTALDGNAASTSHDALDGVKTDAEGRFELRRVPRSLVYLRVEGENLIPLEYGRGGELPKNRIEDLEIAVDLRCHFKVELADPASADELSVLDAEGRALVINIFFGTGRQENERVPIVEGRSHSMAVSDAGRTLVLLRAGREVNRVPLDLVPGELKELRL
ncbi:MAG TPA: sigma-70 family RNA polymerase sigma factor [Planctomycetota bacterium]|jgi:RNA polymerase sigma-70 factor (ECF subfamily)|nr:sigma-70 family RNA polymerase sigma factor [Planctomycetota bacterium]